MAPEPELRLPTDGGLQHLMIDVCRLVLLQLLRCAGNQLELRLVIAPFLLGHLEEEDGLTVLDGNAFRTRHHGGIVVQEPTPVVDIVPVGHLVAQITKHSRLLLTFVFDGLAQDIHQGDTLRSPSLPQTQEQLVEGFVLKGMVELTTLGLLRHPQGQ